MASPAKADHVLASTPAPDALQLAAAEVDNSRLRVNIPTGPPYRDSSVTPPSGTPVAPVVLRADPEDAEAPEASTYTPQDDIRATDEWRAEDEAILLPLDKLGWDYDMKFGQIRKLNGELWKSIMRSFVASPPLQPGNVVVKKKTGMATLVTRL